MRIRSAGRTVRGTGHAINAEYICCVNYPGDAGPLGLYAVADGAAGTSDAEIASEIAVRSLRNCIEDRFRREDFKGGHILAECLGEVNAALLEETRIKGNGVLAASIMCSYIEKDTAHIAYAGGGAAYLVEPGKIMRLTEDVGAGPLEGIDLETLDEGRVPPGWSDSCFKPITLSQKLRRGSSLLFCSDGLVSRVTNVRIQEILLHTESQDEAVERLMEEARKHDDSDDISAVLISLEGTGEPEPEYIEQISYPSPSLIRKYAVVLTVVAAVAAVSLLHEQLMKLTGPTYGMRHAEVIEPAAPAASDRAEPAVPAPARSAGASAPAADIDIKTQPPGAKIFINGVQEQELTPALVEVPAGAQVALRIEMEGYQPHTEELTLAEDQEIQRVLTLRPEAPPAGSLIVKCVPRCDRMALDGTDIKGFPRSEITLRQIEPGRRQLEAFYGPQIQGRTIHIQPDITQATVFRFSEDARAGSQAAAASNQRQPRPDARPRAGQNAPSRTPPPERPEVQVVETQPHVSGDETSLMVENDEENLAELARDSLYGADTDAVNIAFFTVKSSVPECNIMIFQDGALAHTGFTDVRYDLEPGVYTLQVSKPGYRDISKEIELTKEYQTIEIEMQKE